MSVDVVRIDRWLVRADSEPLDVNAATAALAGRGIADLPAKVSSECDARARLTVELPVFHPFAGSVGMSAFKGASEHRATKLVEYAVARARAVSDPANETAWPEPPKFYPRLYGGFAHEDDGEDCAIVRELHARRRSVAQVASRTWLAGPCSDGPGGRVEHLESGFVRVSATPIAARAQSRSAREALLRLAGEANHRLRLCRVLPVTDATHVRLIPQSLVPAANEPARWVPLAFHAVAFARTELAGAARYLADPTAAKIFLELRGIALEDEARPAEEAGALLPTRAAAL